MLAVARMIETARAVLLAEGHVLLMQVALPWREAPLWITPGGGLEPGETAREALARELSEELGPRELTIERELADNVIPIPLYHGVQQQHERYFLVRSARFEPSSASLAPDERAWFRGFRWWPLHEITAAAGCDPFLAELLPFLPGHAP